MAKAKETQVLFDLVQKMDRQHVTDLHSTAIGLSDMLEGEARSLSRQLQLVERAETDPDIKGRIEELSQTSRALVRATDELERAAREVSRIEAQLHRIMGEIAPAAKAAGYNVTVPE